MHSQRTGRAERVKAVSREAGARLRASLDTEHGWFICSPLAGLPPRLTHLDKRWGVRAGVSAEPNVLIWALRANRRSCAIGAQCYGLSAQPEAGATWTIFHQLS